MQVDTTYEPFSEEPEYIEANRAFVASMPLDGVTRVLDLACGTGLMTESLLALRPMAGVVGIDMDAEQIGIATRNFSRAGILVQDTAALEDALAAGRSAVLLNVGNAADLSGFADGSIDLVMIGNAIHLMPNRDSFLAEVYRVLRSGGVFAFNSVFFIGTYNKEAETMFAEWMKDAVLYLNELNEANAKEGRPLVKRQRGTVGVAFDKGWLSPEQWAEALQRQGFTVRPSFKREVRISRQGLEAVGAYGGLSSVLMSGYPVGIASECLQVAAHRVFDRLGLGYVPRFWLEMIGFKQ